ncbi:uncharacterized protein STEHIDRAFT_62704, partial [Stereum hirsutum FP-91666 SS1]|uniref:uncharacterized protein n=1 Tax=Stereum hirsutum (strain FP-91666) TaxID=721885 RepID=UPI000444A64C
VESQVFDRVHRLGQPKDVFVHRLVIANTVEDRILAIEDRERESADRSLGEGLERRSAGSSPLYVYVFYLCRVGCGVEPNAGLFRHFVGVSMRELRNSFGLNGRGEVIFDD